MKTAMACVLFAAGLSAQQYRIDTVAGGYVPNNIPATAAPLNPPIAVAADPAGNYYVADPGGNRVFRVDPAGQIRVFAGNGADVFTGDGADATAAGILYPTALASDASALYITDSTHRVRKVDFATGIINTVAGDGRCTFSGDGG